MATCLESEGFREYSAGTKGHRYRETDTAPLRASVRFALGDAAESFLNGASAVDRRSTKLVISS